MCIEVESDVELISGGDVACKYGASFASVIGRGRAELTEDVQEKIRGLSLFMKNQTGREFNINEEMASTVEVIKVVISEFTAKSRSKVDCQHFFRQIFLGYFPDIVQAFDTLGRNVYGDDYTSLHNPIVLSSVLPAYGMFHSIQILFL